jgi:aspartyl-tRNA(Asn)/glutamyl-tRNA(Gln) amidotransferase subunit A
VTPFTIHDAADAIRAGRSTPLDLLNACLTAIDRYEERVHAWVLVDRESAREQADQLTEEQKRGQVRGPLHGIPVGIKDIFDVFDWPTAAGSKLWAQSIARKDATVVDRLRRAGAVLLGKTVTTQYASFDPPPTRNPWKLDRTPGGSSSGSAAALACGMCLGALGSQTGGSITRPASYCGVAGMKPTYGRVPCSGVVPLAHSMDHPGPMATCVRDLALLLQAIAGSDGLDAECAQRPVPDYVTALEESAKPPILGRLHGLFDERADPVMQELMEQICRRLREHGAQVTDEAPPASFSEVLTRHRTVMAVEAAQFHESRLRRHPSDYDPNIRALLREGLATTAPEYARTKAHQRQLTAEMQSCFQAVDALICPATTGPAPNARTTGDPAFNSPWSYTGLPSISFPAGWTPDRLPLCVQLIGPWWQERELLQTARWCERALGVERRTPGEMERG